MSFLPESTLFTGVGRPEDRMWIFLGNDSVILTLEPDGCMTPLFGRRWKGKAENVHWTPSFRHQAGEGKGLLGHIAGEFLCSPNFGPPCTVRGASIPAHGWTANEEWRLDNLVTFHKTEEAYCELSLDSPAPELPVFFDRRLTVLEGQKAYYSLTTFRNKSMAPLSINVGHHNTVGENFLSGECKVSLCADHFMVAPEGTEFDATGRLAMGAEFDDLTAAPLRTGAVADLTLVNGPVGYTDFVTGAVPRNLPLGWSCVVNKRVSLAYLCFFPGAAALPDGEIALSFNDLWMQYGGRRYRPWADSDGDADRSFCLGTENATGAFASGLEYSLDRPELLGLPTTVDLPPGGERRLCYATALVELGKSLMSEGVRELEVEKGGLVLKGKKAYQRTDLEGDFTRLRESIDWPT